MQPNDSSDYSPAKIFQLLKEGAFAAVRKEILANANTNGRHKWSVLETDENPAEFKDMVFVCGVHRSGTTLIHDYLHAHFDLSFLKAPVPESEGQHMQDVMPSDTAVGGVGRFAFHAAMQLAGSGWDDAAYKAARERLVSQWTPWIRGKSNTILEKSPPNIVRIPALRKMFPGAKFVIWTRHPFAVSEASKKWCRTSNAELLLHWNTAYSLAIQHLEADCIIARYEDFCASPEKEADRIAAFLGLSRREKPASLGDRFKNIKNTNQSYFENFTTPAFGHQKIWKLFGY